MIDVRKIEQAKKSSPHKMLEIEGLRQVSKSFEREKITHTEDWQSKCH